MRDRPHPRSYSFNENPASQTSVIVLPNIVSFSDPAFSPQIFAAPASRVAVKSRISLTSLESRAESREDLSRGPFLEAPGNYRAR